MMCFYLILVENLAVIIIPVKCVLDSFSNKKLRICRIKYNFVHKVLLKISKVVMNNNEHLENLQQIRSMMERSSRFISLSGLSGMAAGIIALVGAAMGLIYLETKPFSGPYLYLAEPGYEKWGLDFYEFFALDAGLVLLFALVGGVFFTTRKAMKKGQKVWDKLTLRLLINLGIPLVTGAIFCLALLKYNMFGLIAPTTLIFYGLSLINGSKYTLNDIRYLGVTEIILGMIGLFNIGYGLEIWAIGFGLMHIIYGTYMWAKYEK